MSEENVEVVKELFRAWEAREPTRATRLIHPEIKVDFNSWSFLSPPSADGREGLDDTIRDWFTAFQGIAFHPERFLDAGDHVVVAMRFTAKGRESGVAVETESAGVYTVRDGLVVELRGYETVADALEAVGLSG